MQSRVDDVNKAVKQLEDGRHPRTKEVKDCQARLNKRYRHRSKSICLLTRRTVLCLVYLLLKFH